MANAEVNLIMQHEASYVISPNPDLMNLFTQFPQFGSLFGKPVVWIVNEGGYGSPTISERIVGLKLLFLAQFRSITIRENIADHVEVLVRMMGDPPYDEAAFDKWWIIVAAGRPQELETALYHISASQLTLLAETKIPKVDSWIQRIKRELLKADF